VLPFLNGIALFITSPPYNQRINRFGKSGIHAETNWVNRITTSYIDDMDESTYQSVQVSVLNACWDAAANDGSLFYNHKIRWRDTVPIFPMQWIGQTRWIPRQELVWARDGSVVQNAGMFPPSDERIFWLRKHSWKWKRHDTKWLSVWKIAAASNTKHPVAFPEEIPRRAILCCSDEQDICCDPFGGSGTVSAVAKVLGRKCISIEIEERYCEIAANRLRQEVLF
jgi:DNA modification methylase